MATVLYRRQGEQFLDNAGNILSGGKLSYFQAGTAIAQATYSDQAGSFANTNPIILNGDGRLTVPVYLGSANDYKELVTTSAGVTVNPWPFDNIPKAAAVATSSYALLSQPWTITTAATVNLVSTDAGKAYECNATSNAITVNLPSAATVGNGKGFTFKKTAGTYSVTLDAYGSETIDGAATLSISGFNESVGIVSDGANWLISETGSSAAASAYSTYFPNAFLKPQGRLTPYGGVPVTATDVIAASLVYYTAYEGNLIPCLNSIGYFDAMPFSSDLTLTLPSAATANNVVDVFATNYAGTLVIGCGPVWATATDGSCSRGTGAGTTELARALGLWTNKNVITLYNGATTYASLAAGTCTYLGSIQLDAVNSQVTCHVSYGQSRKYGVWNAYNRRRIILQAGDSTASWTYATNTWRASNNNTANSVRTFTGLPEEAIRATSSQAVASAAATVTYNTAIGLNSSTTTSGTIAAGAYTSSAAVTEQLIAMYATAPSLGSNTFYQMERVPSGGSVTYYGTQTDMLLSVEYFG
jgi:hypothetical protein